MKKVAVCLFVLALCGASSMGAPIVQWTFDNMTTGTVNVAGTNYTVTQAVDGSGAGNNLNFGVSYVGANVPAPFSASTIPTVAAGKVGNGISLDGGFNEASALGAWKSYKDMSLDFWFKGGDTNGGGNTLITASSVWEINVGNGWMGFTTWNGSNGAANTWNDFWFYPNANTWYHLTASVSESGLKTLKVWDAAGAQKVNATKQVTNGVGYQGLRQSNATIVMGSAYNWGAYYKGVIDEVTITPEPASLAVLGLGALLLRRRK